MADFALLALVGACSGLIAGLVGLAGGIVIVPALVAVYGPQALHAAIITSWFAVLFNSFGAAARQWKQRSPEERVALLHAARWYLAGAVLVTPVAAAFASGRSGMVTAAAVAVLQLCLAAVMLFPIGDEHRARPTNRARDASFGGIIGGVSTLIGVGGGTYTIAYFVYGAGSRFRDAIATANITGFVVGAFSVVGLGLALAVSGIEAVRIATGPFDLLGLAILLLAGIIAAPLGVIASGHLPVKRLRQLLVAALVASAMRLLIS